MCWKNIPIPETILFPLVLGIILEVVYPQPLTSPHLFLDLLGAIAFLAGLILITWSVRTTSTMDMTSPDDLIKTGPYAISRNPMYLAWILIYLSATFITRSLWCLLLFPIAMVATHFIAILPEERALRETFGESFEKYCNQVRRYL